MFAALSMALTLALWNLFAGPDREAAAKRVEELASTPLQSQPTEIVQPAVEAAPELPTGPIFLGGSAPQTQIIVTTKNGGGGGGNGGGSGSGSPVTSTSSS